MNPQNWTYNNFYLINNNKFKQKKLQQMLKIDSFDLNTFTESLSKIADAGRTLIHRNFIPGVVSGGSTELADILQRDSLWTTVYGKVKKNFLSEQVWWSTVDLKKKVFFRKIR